ncbi:MAG: ABC transporter ATP-binding protein [Clostridia bacterium]|nr:ABC transporter ATP-binding protein [Clostridia bacterium]
MLKINSLEKTYKNATSPSLKNVNLTIDSGVVCGFVGKNGAGKSTLIKCITGILPFEKGDIVLNKNSILTHENIVKQNIGYVPDNHAVYENLTGREYVNFVADIYNVSQELRDKRIAKYSKMFELSGYLDQQIKSYSHGMCQKICIIGALVHDPKLWILDEPFLGLDYSSRDSIKKCVLDYAKNKKHTVIFSSHDIDTVIELCDIIAVIENGAIKDEIKNTKTKRIKTKLEDYLLN